MVIVLTGGLHSLRSKAFFAVPLEWPPAIWQLHRALTLHTPGTLSAPDVSEMSLVPILSLRIVQFSGSPGAL